MGTITFSELQEVVWDRYARDKTVDKNFLDINLACPGYYTCAVDDQFANKVVFLKCHYGPMSFIFDNVGILYAIVISLHGERFDPRALDRSIWLPSITYAEITDLLRSSGRLDITRIVYISFAGPDARGPEPVDVETFNCGYGFVTVDIRRNGDVKGVEIS